MAAPATATLPIERLCCPDCRTPVFYDGPGLTCSRCAAVFETVVGVPKMWPPSRKAALQASIDGFRAPRAAVRTHPFFRAMLPPNPICDPGQKSREARVKQAIAGGGLVVNLGSKADRWGAHVLNLDLVLPAGHTEENRSVHLLGDIERLPFPDNSVDAVICTYVLEHVGDARACMDEIVRVVRPGGHVFITVPFIFPTHPDPLDRWRWTLDGLRYSLRGFKEIEAGPCGGAFTAMLCITPTMVGSIFSNFYLFNATRFALGWLMWPSKFLDYLAAGSRRSYMTAANFFFFGQKP